jgi:DNA mismatch repair protein MutL
VRRVQFMSPKRPDIPPRETLDKLYGENSPESHREGETASARSSDFSLLGGDTLEAAMLEREDLSGLVYMGQFAGLYLLFKSGKELFIVDQHAAHERVLYEKNQEIIEKGGAISQNLLFPINIDLPADQYALFEEAYEILKSVGFEAEPFGSRTVMVSAVPSVLTRKSPEKMFTEILNDVEDLRKGGHEIRKAIAQSIACRGAVMAGDRMNEEEAMKLMGSLLQTETRYCCPHGRPIVFRISRDELDRKFGRK